MKTVVDFSVAYLPTLVMFDEGMKLVFIRMYVLMVHNHRRTKTYGPVPENNWILYTCF